MDLSVSSGWCIDHPLDHPEHLTIKCFILMHDLKDCAVQVADVFASYSVLRDSEFN